MKLRSIIAITLLALTAMLPAAFAGEKNEVVPELAKVLATADEATLYSLTSESGKDPKAGFHGYPILGETQLKGKDLGTIIGEFNQAVKNSDGVIIRCFSPRHGLKVKSAGEEFDVVICFECAAYHVYQKAKLISKGGLKGNGKEMNAVLAAAKVPLPPPAK
jgi:hypothetical protein